MKKTKLETYLIGSMEGRQENIVRKERRDLRGLLNDVFAGTKYDLHINDPILKEKHRPNTTMDMETCGFKPLDVFEMDLRDVEKSDILYWSTADTISEGSEVEFAGGGLWNRWCRKKWFKKQWKPKLLIMIGEKRAKKTLNKFQNMWPNVRIFSTHEKAMQFLKKYYKLGGKNAIHIKRRSEINRQRRKKGG